MCLKACLGVSLIDRVRPVHAYWCVWKPRSVIGRTEASSQVVICLTSTANKHVHCKKCEYSFEPHSSLFTGSSCCDPRNFFTACEKKKKNTGRMLGFIEFRLGRDSDCFFLHDNTPIIEELTTARLRAERTERLFDKFKSWSGTCCCFFKCPAGGRV